MLGEAAMPFTRRVDLPGRGTTQVWECAGPRGAETVVLIHGVACTAELNWGRFSRRSDIISGSLLPTCVATATGSPYRSRFRLEDCADDIAALAGVLHIRRFAAVGYSMGGMVAQLLYRRHAALLSGLVLCSTATNVRGSPAEQLAASAMPAVAAALRWNPMLNLMGAEAFGTALLGRVDDPATGTWSAPSCAGPLWLPSSQPWTPFCEFTPDSWISQVDVPTAVIVTDRDRVVPPGRQLPHPPGHLHRPRRHLPAAHRADQPARDLFAKLSITPPRQIIELSTPHA